MAIVVVAIHVHPFEGYEKSIGIELYSLICSCAVPFFFLCTGYFLAQRIEGKSMSVKLQIMQEWIKKLLRLYVIWSIVYLPLAFWDYFTNSSPWWKDVLSYMKGLILVGEHYNSWILWYLLSAVYGLLFVYWLFKKNVDLTKIVLCGFACYWLGTGISVFVQYSGELSNSIQIIQKTLKAAITHGRILTSFFFLPMGMLLRRFSGNKSIAGSLFVMAVIGWLITEKGILMAFPTALGSVGIFMLTLNMDMVYRPFYKYLRTSSTVIYFVHMWMWTMLCGILYQKMMYGMGTFLLVSMISIIVSLAYIAKNRRTAKKAVQA